jgi:hypothetical protein
VDGGREAADCRVNGGSAGAVCGRGGDNAGRHGRRCTHTRAGTMHITRGRCDAGQYGGAGIRCLALVSDEPSSVVFEHVETLNRWRVHHLTVELHSRGMFGSAGRANSPCWAFPGTAAAVLLWDATSCTSQGDCSTHAHTRVCTTIAGFTSPNGISTYYISS